MRLQDLSRNPPVVPPRLVLRDVVEVVAAA